MVDLLYPLRVILGNQLTSEQMELCKKEAEKQFRLPVRGVTLYCQDEDGNFYIRREFESNIPFEGLRYVTRTYDSRGRLMSVESPSETVMYSPPGSLKRKVA